MVGEEMGGVGEGKWKGRVGQGRGVNDGRG